MMPVPRHAGPALESAVAADMGSSLVARERFAWPVETPPPGAGSAFAVPDEPRESIENTAEMRKLASSFQKLGCREERTPECPKNIPVVCE